MSDQVYVITIAREKVLINHNGNQNSGSREEHCVIKLLGSTFLTYNPVYLSKNHSHAAGGFIGIGILVFSVLLSMMVTCLPQHNVITQPEYWYETLSPLVSWVPIFAARNIIEGGMLLKTKKILSWKLYFKHFIWIALGKALSFTTFHFIWTYALELRHPMPFHGHLTVLLTYTVFTPLSLWFLFPRHLRRKNSTTRTQIWQFIQLLILRIIAGIGYTKLPSFPLMKYDNLQWTLGILLPLLKKFNVWWHAKMALKISKGDKEVADIDTIISIGTLHSFGLALLLGSLKLSSLTAFTIMASDFLLNAWSCKNIVNLHKRSSRINGNPKNSWIQETDLRDRSLKYLALKEFLEILIPSMYCFCFAAAYFGPNAEIIGNVKLEMWGHVKVISLSDQLWNVGLFIIIDSLRAISIAFILWRFCKLNLYAGYCYVVKRYGWFILFYSATMINAQFISVSIWYGSDNTYKFEWLSIPTNGSSSDIGNLTLEYSQVTY